jgi:hypothetical protein
MCNEMAGWMAQDKAVAGQTLVGTRLYMPISRQNTQWNLTDFANSLTGGVDA